MTIRIFVGASSDWTEADIDGDSAPENGAEISSFEGDIQIGQVVEFDVTSLIETPGIYTMIVEADDSPLDVSFVSKEGEAVEEQPFLAVVALPPSDPNVLVSCAIDFGSLPILDSEQPIEFTVFNTGETEVLTLSDVALGGADADHFTLVETPDSIAPNGEGMFQLRFNGKQELGGFLADLSFATNDPDAEEQSVTVSLMVVVPNPDGPVAHYGLDEAAGSAEVVDSTGNGNIASIDGGTTLGVAGVREGSGTAFAFDGSGVVERQEAFPLDSFTISLWFQANDLGDAESFDLRTMVGQGEANPTVDSLLGSGDLIWFADAEIAFRTAGGPIQVGEVYHVAMRYEGNGDTGTASILLDGVEVASEEIDAPLAERVAS